MGIERLLIRFRSKSRPRALLLTAQGIVLLRSHAFDSNSQARKRPLITRSSSVSRYHIVFGFAQKVVLSNQVEMLFSEARQHRWLWLNTAKRFYIIHRPPRRIFIYIIKSSASTNIHISSCRACARVAPRKLLPLWSCASTSIRTCHRGVADANSLFPRQHGVLRNQQIEGTHIAASQATENGRSVHQYYSLYPRKTEISRKS